MGAKERGLARIDNYSINSKDNIKQEDIRKGNIEKEVSRETKVAKCAETHFQVRMRDIKKADTIWALT